ncbi:MAG: RIP metalloprotease RseP [Flavobacteriaceae bacterium]|nr:RIP metalloprotease RseP [Flavobacteriaceae bacterium]MCY4267464.1 RIP metalloprotease RseP [Flavobacteriaceae bacterium]MCY4299148.1 RIP metalloprotease RseP [Flavobacteriaceae bacterium]
MDIFLIKAFQFLLSLSLLIILHELGHYIPARIFKTRVERFFLFFDVKFALFKKKIGETIYGIGWLPLGGYVKISGMIDESMDREQMKQPPKPWEFRSKPTWQRLIIMLGGVIVNLLLGFGIYMMILFIWGKNELKSEDLSLGFRPSPIAQELGFQYGDQLISVDGKELDNVLDINRLLLLRNTDFVQVKRRSGQIETISIPKNLGDKLFQNGEILPLEPSIQAIIDSVIPGSPAFDAGIQSDDRIVEISDQVVYDWYQMTQLVPKQPNQTLEITYLRDQTKHSIELTTDQNGHVGIFPQLENFEFHNRKLSITESITEGFEYGYWTLYDYIAQFKYVFTKKGASQLGGFGTIGNLFPSAWDWRQFWATTAFISIILAFMNILPIPALDGGHVLFLLYEMFTGKKPHEKFLEYAQIIGFIFLISLVLYANGNDIVRFFSS